MSRSGPRPAWRRARTGDPWDAGIPTRVQPYAYLRIVDGEIVAPQGTIKAAAA